MLELVLVQLHVHAHAQLQVKEQVKVQSGHYQNEAIQFFNKANTDISLRTNTPKLESEGPGDAANGLMAVVLRLLLSARKLFAIRVNIGIATNRQPALTSRV